MEQAGIPGFARTFHVGWNDVDMNGHMANSAYLTKAVDVRMMFFQESGFPITEFQRLRLGPVIARDDMEYFREFRLLDPITVTLIAAGMSEDGSRFQLRNEFYRADHVLAARLTSTGGWLDLNTRRLIQPPESLMEVMNKLVRVPDFATLPTSIKGASK